MKREGSGVGAGPSLSSQISFLCYVLPVSPFDVRSLLPMRLSLMCLSLKSLSMSLCLCRFARGERKRDQEYLNENKEKETDAK